MEPGWEDMTDTTESVTPSEPSATDSTGAVAVPGDYPPPTFPPDNSGNRAVWLAAVLLAIVVVALLIALLGDLRHWFALHTGIKNGGPDPYYNFWSGFGSDLGEATLISAVAIGVYTGVRKVNCHTKGCWRIGHHSLEGTPYILCKHHHPHVPNRGATHEDILAQHRRFRAERDAARKVAT